MKELKPGDDCVFRYDYDCLPAKVLKINPKSIKLEIRFPMQTVIQNCKPSYVIHSEQPCVVVWECWKGVNGRGGYRFDTENYKHLNKPAKFWIGSPSWEFLTEDEKPNFM